MSPTRGEVTDDITIRFDESLVPRDPKGQWTFGGGKPHDPAAPDDAGPTGAAAANTGIDAVGKLVDKAASVADYENTTIDEDGDPIEAGSWENLTPHAQDQVLQDFYENWEAYDSIDTSGIDQDYENDLRRDNDDLIDEAEKETLAAMATDPAFADPDPTLPEGDFKLRISVDPQTIEVGEDDGDGAKVDLEKLRTLNDQPLTPEQQTAFEKTWDRKYQDAFDTRFEDRYNDSSWQESESELRDQQQNAEFWSNMSDEDKYAKAVDIGVADEMKSSPMSHVSGGLPTQWVTGIEPDANIKQTEDYQRTRAIARSLTQLRTNQIITERGLATTWSDSESRTVWSEWKSSSSNPTSWALQIATSQELGSLDRLSDEQRASGMRAADRLGGMDTLKAYVRAQWETTQFVMHKAGEEQISVYRGLMLAGDSVDGASKEWIDSSGHPIGSGGGGASEPTAASFTRLPGVELKRASLQSTSAKREVANGWGGVGEKPPNAKRVVLRIQAPRTAVFSIPVYGANVQTEHETVLAGLPSSWHWDAWVDRAPTFNLVPIPSTTAHAHRAKKMTPPTKPLVLDLQDPEGQPHWLSKQDPRLVVKQQQAKEQGKVDDKTHRPAKPAKRADPFASVRAAARAFLLRYGGAYAVPPERRFDESLVPRNPKGEWTFGGEPKKKKKDTGDTPSKQPAVPPPDGGETLYSAKDALESLLNGERVNIAQEDVRKFLKLAGKQHEDPDLTDVHVEGMQIFGGNGLGIARARMPQIPKEMRDDFVKYVKSEGYDVKREDVSPLKLAPTQREISARLAAEKLAKYEKDPKRPFPPILVAQDHHVVDGHHHWGMMAAVAVDNPEVKMPIYRIMASPAQALLLMKAYAKKHHIANKDTGG